MASIETDDLLTTTTVVTMIIAIIIIILILVTIIYVCYLIVYVSNKNAKLDENNSQIEAVCTGFQNNNDGTFEIQGTGFTTNTKVYIRNNSSKESSYIKNTSITPTTINFKYNKSPNDTLDIIIQHFDKIITTITIP